MLRTLTVTAAAIALTAGAANAACDARMDTLSKDYGDYLENERYSGSMSRPVIHDLRNAALRLKTQGMDESCQAVMGALEDVLDDYREVAETTETNDDAMAKPDMARFESERETIEQRVVAVKDGGLTFDTGSLVGVNVYNYENDFLGEVDGLLVQNGNAPTHMIVGHGGFWNIGDEEAAIPLAAFKWDPEWEVFYVDMTGEQLDSAPDYDLKNGEWTIDKNDGFYDSVVNG